ncbi:hypothetical protein M758_3G048700 [Ceratodon purpureus]|nr:hypothetical protein M758_3G048700 [Ceratodon purpureus]
MYTSLPYRFPFRLTFRRCTEGERTLEVWCRVLKNTVNICPLGLRALVMERFEVKGPSFHAYGHHVVLDAILALWIIHYSLASFVDIHQPRCKYGCWNGTRRDPLSPRYGTLEERCST